MGTIVERNRRIRHGQEVDGESFKKTAGPLEGMVTGPSRYDAMFLEWHIGKRAAQVAFGPASTSMKGRALGRFVLALGGSTQEAGCLLR